QPVYRFTAGLIDWDMAFEFGSHNGSSLSGRITAGFIDWDMALELRRHNGSSLSECARQGWRKCSFCRSKKLPTHRITRHGPGLNLTG
ncbi:MAG: hypothetical protein V7629_21500, partial [Motiliproteus sp.]